MSEVEIAPGGGEFIISRDGDRLKIQVAATGERLGGLMDWYDLESIARLEQSARAELAVTAYRRKELAAADQFPREYLGASDAPTPGQEAAARYWPEGYLRLTGRTPEEDALKYGWDLHRDDSGGED